MTDQANESPRNHQPYIAHDQSMKEFTLRAIVPGIIFGMLFGASNAYLGLLVGITVSTSIPVAVMTVGFFGLTKRYLGKATILESNMSQTIGSASSSLASGAIFTLPALFLWGMEPTIWQMAGLACLGGLLGILFMIPLRRFLIKEEHGKLPYPEGTACAKVLIASDKKGTSAKNVFLGIIVGSIFKLGVALFMLWKEKIVVNLPILNKAQIGVIAKPALLGVGYILGFRISAIMVSGSMVSWLVLIPLLAHIGQYLTVPLAPETSMLLSEMSASQIWNKYIRYIGAGAVAFGGIVTVIRSVPTMVRSFKLGVSHIQTNKVAENKAIVPRTENDMPFKFVLIGVLIIIAIITIIPNLLGGHTAFSVRLIAAPAIAIFAFFFVTVSSRIVGLIGVSSNPTSGMTIVTVLAISMVFVFLGWTDAAGKATVLTIGTVVCVAASIAGDTSQDLKTGFLVGATPRKQQIGELIGATTSALVVCGAIIILAHTYQFGSTDLPALQATLIMTIIDGVLQTGIPWELIFVGVFFGVIIELLSLPSLPFAVGLYLPITSMTPIFLGGCIRYFVERKHRNNPEKLNRSRENGILFGSGLVGGEGFTMIIISLYAYYQGKPQGVGLEWSSPLGEIIAFILFALMGYILVQRTQSK